MKLTSTEQLSGPKQMKPPKNSSIDKTQQHLKQIPMNKSIEGIPSHKILTHFPWNEPSKVKKRNIRQKSFNYNQTECSFIDKCNTSINSNSKHCNSFYQSKIKGISAQLSQLSTNKPNQSHQPNKTNKIPFKKANKQHQAKLNKGLMNRRLSHSKDSNQDNAQSPFVLNQYEVISLENSSESSNRSLTRKIQEKLIHINNDLKTLINTSNDQQKQMIIKEVEKMYKGIALNSHLPIQDEIECLKAENRAIREENKTLNTKVAEIDENLTFMKKESEANSNNIWKKLNSIDKMKLSLKSLSSQLNKFKKSKSNGSKNHKLGDEYKKKHDFLIDQVQCQSKKKSKKRVNEEVRYQTEANEFINSTMEKESLTNLSITDNLKVIANNYHIEHTKKLLPLKFPSNDFNEEFLQYYDEFSPSWRKEVDMMNERKKHN